MPVVEVVCLANSWKHGGRCVAGLRTDGGGWIRPVSLHRHGALSREHYILDDKSEAQLLDVLMVDLEAARPQPHQPENWLIGRIPWTLVDRPARLKRPESLFQALRHLMGTRTSVARPSGTKIASLLRSHLVSGPELLGNTSDRVSFEALTRVPAPASLALVAPTELKWVIRTGHSGRPQARASFALSGQRYNLAVTDPVWAPRVNGLPLGEHAPEAAGLEARQRVFFTISLGEPFEHDNYCYKLVAAIIALPSTWDTLL